MSEPTCRTCYLKTLTGDELQRFHMERTTSTIHLCPPHQAAEDALLATLDWSAIRVVRPGEASRDR